METGDRVGRCRCLSKLKLYDSIYCFLCRFQLVNKRILDTNGLKSKFDALCAMQVLSVNNSNFFFSASCKYTITIKKTSTKKLKQAKIN